MQSGIAASQQLRDAFFELDKAPSEKRGLVVGISKEQLIPVTHLGSRSADFFEDLHSVQDALKDNEAAYVILRRYPDAADGYVAVTYVPDTANVRQKMLFASTRLTLVRELGTERFRETLFATTKDELTPEGWKKHDKHSEVKAPLTEEERTLQGVKEAEAEASRSTSDRKIITKGFQSPVSAAGLAAIQELPSSNDNLVQLRVDPSTESVELVGTSRTDVESLSGAISATEPRYSFFRYDHSHDGSAQSPVIFISSCPSSTKIKDRMLHAASRAAFFQTAKSQAAFNLDKRLEVADTSELTAAAVHDEFHPKTEQKQGFARPKRPGRK